MGRKILLNLGEGEISSIELLSNEAVGSALKAALQDFYEEEFTALEECSDVLDRAGAAVLYRVLRFCIKENESE